MTANPSLGKESTLSYVNSNILAIQHGYFTYVSICFSAKTNRFFSCVTATEMRQYMAAHPNIRMKEVIPMTGRGVRSANHEGPFGVKTRL